MAVPFSNTKLRVPQGFQNILEGLAREVLRSQPKEIFEFGSHYFETLLKVREETGHDPAVHGAKVEDRFYNNDSFKSPSTDPSNPQQQEAAVTIQTNYRQHAAKQEVQEMKEEDAAVTIQAGVRGFIDRQKVLETQQQANENKDPEEYKRRQEEVQERLAADQSATATAAAQEEEEVDIDLNDPDVEKAAIKIQAGFKGFKARKGVQEAKSVSSQPTSEIDIDLNDPEVEDAAIKIQPKETEPVQDTKTEEDELADIDLTDPDLANAATKIQASFRGHKTRKTHQVGRKETETQETQASQDNIESQKESDSQNEVTEQSEKIEQSENTEQSQKEAIEDKQEEEEVDIDLSDPDVANAAVKIQAGFRGHMARKNVQSKKDENVEAPKIEETQNVEETQNTEVIQETQNTEVIQEIQNEMDTQETQNTEETQIAEETQNTEETQIAEETQNIEETQNAEETQNTQETQNAEEVDIDLNDPDVANAAVKIQAGFRGHMARKTVQSKKSEESQQETPEKVAEQEEEVDIDLTDPEVEKAATKIQASFKGHKARMEVKAKKDEKQEEEQQAPAAEEEKKQEEEEVDIDLEDPQTEKAAVMIQAQFRGFKTRKDIMEKKDSEEKVEEEKPAEEESSKQQPEEEEVDIDLTDPEVEKAALKIQSGFKGFKARKENKKDSQEDVVVEKQEEETKEEAQAEAQKPEEEEVDIDLTDPEVEKAALKIQAGFKGFKTRKDKPKEDEQ